MVNTDSYYEIGSGHTFCQDYVDNGVVEINGAKFYYSICCDGCSGSKDSDVGARLIAKSFPRALRYALTDAEGREQYLAEYIKVCLKNRIMNFIEQMECPLWVFDATIAAIVYDEEKDKLYSFGWGDGKFLYKHKDGTADLVSIDYTSNAPYYLTYELSGFRAASYEESFGTDFATISRHIVSGDTVLHNKILDQNKARFYYEVTSNASQTLVSASVFTDGIDTYHKKDDVDLTMPRSNLFNQLTQYKGTHGEFVKRRMMKVKQFCQKEGWQHFDDVGVGTISLL